MPNLPKRGNDEALEIYRRASDLCAPSSGAGTAVEDICRSMGISQATFYIWKKKFGELDASEVRRLRQLEEENLKLKKLVADLTLDKSIL